MKVARDVLLKNGKYLFGEKQPNDEYAMKGSAHELLGASHYFDVFESLGHPIIPAMQSLVDFKGCRIVALPLLPITKETLVYGSCDGGLSVKNSKEFVAEKMKDAAAILHLAGHMVGKCLLYTAGDVEVHEAHDGNYYLLDLARCFPPESILAVEDSTGQIFPHSSIFHRMLRPEALLLWKEYDNRADPPGKDRPLSSDAWTKWGEHNRLVYDQDVYDATVFILGHQVNILASRLLSKFSEAGNENATLWDINIAALFHECGVNMRHLGPVAEACETLIEKRSDAQDPKKKKQYHKVIERLSAEILFRALKNMLRGVLRDKDLTADSEFRAAVIRFVNDVFKELSFGLHSLVAMEKIQSQIVDNYGVSAFHLVLRKADVWKPHLSSIILRVFKRCGIVVESETRDTLSQTSVAAQVRKLSPSEIVSFVSSIKKMSVFDILLAKELIQAANSAKNENSTRWRKISLRILNECFSKFPKHKELLQLINVQRTLLFMPSESSDTPFAEQRETWIEMFRQMDKATNEEIIRCGRIVRRDNRFLGLQLAIFLMEISRDESKENFETLPDWLNPEKLSEFFLPDLPVVTNDPGSPRSQSEIEVESDSTVLEIFMLLQMARTKLYDLGRSVPPMKWDFAKIKKKYDQESPENAMAFAISHNTFLGYDSLDMRVQRDIVQRISTVHNIVGSNLSSHYISRFTNLPVKASFIALLLPKDFSPIMDSLSETRNLNLYFFLVPFNDIDFFVSDIVLHCFKRQLMCETFYKNQE
jgi:hypothetical protein